MSNDEMEGKERMISTTKTSCDIPGDLSYYADETPLICSFSNPRSKTRHPNSIPSPRNQLAHLSLHPFSA
jgi:hypothetical protein